MIEEMELWFVEVLLPLKVPRPFTYYLPNDIQSMAEIGKRVEVPFGKQKIYAGLITKIHNNKPVGYNAKQVISILDDKPMVGEIHIRFWEWMSAYYMCDMGEVMNAALPAAFKLDSESHLTLNPHSNVDFAQLTDKEYLLAEALTIRQEITLDEAQKIVGLKSVRQLVNNLVKRGVVIIHESISERYKPKMETYVFLNDIHKTDSALAALFKTLELNPKRQNVLIAWIELIKLNAFVIKRDLIKRSGCTDALLKGMVESSIFRLEKKDVYRLQEEEAKSLMPVLSDVQFRALNEVKDQFNRFKTVLLHGITSSGKTTLYMHLIKEAIDKDGQVLYLLPEIAITQQMINRLRAVFGEEVGVYHSQFNNNERVEIWNKLLSGYYKIIIGARSCLFLPFHNLSLIIVDEEHEPSFKQQDPAPRYNARDAALYLAGMNAECKTLLGSATPSLETFHNAEQKKYGYVALNSRYGDIKNPNIIISDLAEAYKRKEMIGAFTKFTIDKMKSAIAKKEQVIVFQNRRGFAPFIQCVQCGWVPVCPNCDVSLTYYKYTNDLRCHYCNYRSKVYTICLVCNNNHLMLKGTGTEKLEEEIQKVIPQVRITRMDSDTTKTRHKQNKIIADVDMKAVDVLVGTQMVVKGLDFAHVNTVVVPEGDALMSFPDFRSSERGFQMLMQVAGRAGRRQTQGEVIIQAVKKDNPVYSFVLNADYLGFYKYELALRKEFNYPPFTRLIILELKHFDVNVLRQSALQVYQQLSRSWGTRVFQPTEPAVNKVQNKYRLQLMIKMERDNVLIQKIKADILKVLHDMHAQSLYKQVQVILDIDPI